MHLKKIPFFQVLEINMLKSLQDRRRGKQEKQKEKCTYGKEKEFYRSADKDGGRVFTLVLGDGG